MDVRTFLFAARPLATAWQLAVGRVAALAFTALFTITVAAHAVEAPPNPTWKFAFGAGPAPAGYVRVEPTATFNETTGYGFEPGTTPVVESREAAEPLHAGFITASQPFLFSAKVPEGNYRVTVVLGDATGGSDITIKAESRRLMLEHVTTASGGFVTRSFIVNVRNARLPAPPANAPGDDAVRLNDRERGVFHWDDKLTLEFNGPAPKVCALEIAPAEVPTIFLAGDSTVTDQPSEPAASWGQMLTGFLKPEIAVANHAESGETMKSFITGLRLDKILSQLKPGDWLFIQFGHNDSKSGWPQTYVEAASTYRDYLRVFIGEARRRGATPVLVTSPQRRTFGSDGKIQDSHGGYPDAVRAVAREQKVAVIDLTTMSAAFYEALGPEQAPLAFSNNGRDATHHDNYGAYELAKCIVTGIRAAGLPLARFIRDDVPPFDPAHPDPAGSFALPASPGRSTVTPRGS